MSFHKLKELQIKDSRSAYCKVGTDLIVYALGVIGNDIKTFKTTFTDEMADTGRSFLKSLQMFSTLSQDRALRHFLFSLFSQKKCGEATKYDLLVYSFLVLYSFTEHGNLQACSDFSRYFSKVVFFARAAIFKRISSEAKGGNKGFFE